MMTGKIEWKKPRCWKMWVRSFVTLSFLLTNDFGASMSGKIEPMQTNMMKSSGDSCGMFLT